MRRNVIFLQLLILFKICTEFTRIIFILKNKSFYKKSIYSERSTFFWISRDRNFLCRTLPYNIFGTLCLSDSVMNGTSRTPSPTEKRYREYKHYLTECRGRHPLHFALQGRHPLQKKHVGVGRRGRRPLQKQTHRCGMSRTPSPTFCFARTPSPTFCFARTPSPMVCHILIGLSDK